MSGVLITGASGMLGHRLVLEFVTRGFEVHSLVRSGDSDGFLSAAPLRGSKVHTGIDLLNFKTLEHVIRHVSPEVVVNAAGLIKQKTVDGDNGSLDLLNADLPRAIGNLSEEFGFRFIQISTDCVFKGTRGKYSESDIPDCSDEYGISKFRGENCGTGSLVLRTSIVGRELKDAFGLLEWFLTQRGGKVAGFESAFFSGLTTNELARIVSSIIETQPMLQGLYHVAGERISKAALLEIANEVFDAAVTIERTSEPFIDRSLDSRAFNEITGYEPPGWKEMLTRVAADSHLYEKWRMRNC